MNNAALRGKRIVITGGSLGIGLAVAEECAREGATVMIAARNDSDLEAALSRLRSISAEQHEAHHLDVSDRTQVEEFALLCDSRNLSLQGLVNCAGVLGPIGNSTRIDLEEFVRTVSINFFGTVFMSTIISSRLSSRTRKKIVNFSGGGAATPLPNYSAYATSKAAVVRFTENLSVELAEDAVDVNCVAPGFVVTRLHDQTLAAGSANVGERYFEETKRQIRGGGVSPSMAAQLTVFLLSERSDGITGKFISAPWDPWKEQSFQQRLRNDPDLATLRRIDEKKFFMQS